MAHLWVQIQHPSHIWIRCSNISTAQLHYSTYGHIFPMARINTEWDIYRVFATKSDRISLTTLDLSSTNIYRKMQCATASISISKFGNYKSDFCNLLTVTTEHSFTEIHLLFTVLNASIFIQNGSKTEI